MIRDSLNYRNARLIAYVDGKGLLQNIRRAISLRDVLQEKEKVALGLKQKSENPWMHIEEKYPVGSRVKGQVVNIMSYGAFVKLETGIEGLVHISETS